MRKLFLIFAGFLAVYTGAADAATTRAMRSGTTAVERTANPVAAYNYNYMYPYMNNQMRTVLNPGVTTSQSSNPINAIVHTEQLSAPRRVVARPNAATARAGTGAAVRSGTQSTATTARAGGTTSAAATNTNANRRVVARSAAGGTSANPRAATTARASRGDNYYLSGMADTPQSVNDKVSVSTSRCLADYVECMNGYCKRDDMAYNRCYCSSKLAQIDAQYKTDIDNLIKELLTVSGTNQWSQEEMNEYWMSVVGQYAGGNSWTRLEDALNIDWASTESRVRGQQSLTIGHEYCSQHLSNCFYMADNMRDAYISQITRDCQTYEQSLQRLKTVLESVIKTYD